jgi:iron complex outermembrane recepter protein
VFENFGATRREGVEARLDWHPLSDLHIDAVYGSAKTEVTENATAALIGKKVTGVPDYTTTLSAFWRPQNGLGGGATIRKVGRSAINPTNTLTYDGYTTLDLQLSYQRSRGRNPYRAYLSLDNATDKKYAAASFVIGGQTLYAPAAPRSVSIGLQIDFN